MRKTVCLNCGASQAADLTNCVNCNAALPQITTLPKSIADRPDDSRLKAMGAIALVVGAILIALSFLTSPYEFAFSEAPDPDRVKFIFWASVGGGALASTGLLLLLTGIIVHAISFLPADGGES